MRRRHTWLYQKPIHSPPVMDGRLSSAHRAKVEVVGPSLQGVTGIHDIPPHHARDPDLFSSTINQRLESSGFDRTSVRRAPALGTAPDVRTIKLIGIWIRHSFTSFFAKLWTT